MEMNSAGFLHAGGFSLSPGPCCSWSGALSFQAFFISVEDLYEGLDAFWPSLEYKIWLKLALSIAYQYFKASLEDEVSYMMNAL